MAKSRGSVAIIYGFAEGTWHSKQLRKQLQSKGYRVISDPRAADIILAHSGGCYMVPADTRAHIVFHIGYTYWPSRPLIQSLRMAQRADLQTQGVLRWLRRSIFHCVYALNLGHTLRLVPGWRDPKRRLAALAPMTHIFVRNREDSYCNLDALLSVTSSEHTYISMSGTHEDVWDNPAPYVNLIQSVYG